MPEPSLTPKQQAFVTEYLIDLNATQAAIRAGYSAATAQEQGSRLLSNAKVAVAIDAGKIERANRNKATAEWVIEEFRKIAAADPNELIEHRRRCCRHCWGVGFRYQSTAQELATARRAHEQQRIESVAGSGEDPGEFDAQGGDGFDHRREPNPACTECLGEGVGDVMPKDTRKLSPEGRALYAGVKVTKDGIEIKTHSREKALEMLGRHFSLFNDKLDVKVSGDLTTRILEARKRG